MRHLKMFLMLLVGFLVLMVAGGTTIWFDQRRTNEVEAQIQALLAAEQWLGRIEQVLAEEQWLILEKAGMNQQSDVAGNVLQLSKRFQQPQWQILTLNLELSDRKKIEEIRRLESQWLVLAQHFTFFKQKGDLGKAGNYFSQLKELDDQINTILAQVKEKQFISLVQLSAEMRETNRLVAIITMLIGLACLGIMVFSIVQLRKRILTPIRSLVDTVSQEKVVEPSGLKGLTEWQLLGKGMENVVSHMRQIHFQLNDRLSDSSHALHQSKSQLLQSEKLAAIGQLVSGVAHEVNNPLTVIMGCSDLMLNQLPEEELRLRNLAEDISNQAERCKEIVQSLLQFSRKEKPKRSWFDFNQNLDQVIKLREYELATSRIQIHREFSPHLPKIKADRHRIQQVFINLLNNAIDAIRDDSGNGDIYFETHQSGDYIIMTIRDSGPGVQDGDKVFEAFFTTKESGKGTGLGLSVCKQIIEEHGGTLIAKNWERGALFEVQIPVFDDTTDSFELTLPSYPDNLDSSVKRALVIDDEQPILEVQSAYLNKLNFEVKCFESVESALDYVLKAELDLILSDIRLKGDMNGFDFFQWISINRPDLVPTFMFMSGDIVALNSLSLKNTGRPFLQKPFSFKQFRKTLHQEGLL